MKNIVIIGDSYSTFKGYHPEEYEVYYDGNSGTYIKSVQETWWHRLVTKTESNLILNDSWSGSTVCYTGRRNPEYAYRSSFINRMHILLNEDFFKKNNVDTVFVFGATNDSWLETTPLGEAKFENWCEDDLYSTLPAISYMISTLKKELPECKIYFIINTDLDENIVKTIKEASNFFGTSYIELENIDKINGHPTAKGMSAICEQVISQL